MQAHQALVPPEKWPPSSVGWAWNGSTLVITFISAFSFLFRLLRAALLLPVPGARGEDSPPPLLLLDLLFLVGEGVNCRRAGLLRGGT